MMPAPYNSHPVARVLDYLETIELAANRANNRFAALHYTDAWVFTFERVFGQLPKPWNSHQPIALPLVPEHQPAKIWRRELASRPMRRIVRRYERVIPAKGKQPAYTDTIEVLECKHEQAEPIAFMGERPARHRRCKQCATPARAASIALVKRRQA